jgi:hypothetical protein
MALRKMCPANDIEVREGKRAGLLFRWNLIAGSRRKTGSAGEENRYTSAFFIRRNSLLQCPNRQEHSPFLFL